MHFTVPVWQTKTGVTYSWTTVGLGPHTAARAGASPEKIQQQIIESLRKVVEGLAPRDLRQFELKRGTQLVHVRVELTLRGANRRKVSGLCPLILQPHPTSQTHTLMVAYHPERQDEWFPVREAESLAEQATAVLQQAWGDLDDEAIAALWSQGKDTLKVFSFSATPKSLLDQLPARQRNVFDDLNADPTQKKQEKRGGLTVLPKLGVDDTARVADLPLAGGIRGEGRSRSPYREQLQLLLASGAPQPTLVVGDAGVGKSVLIEHAISDRLLADDFDGHRNLDRVHHVWSVSGKRLIAGMSYVGDWEQRCVGVLEDCRNRKIILRVPDLHLFGQLGKARSSERCFADFFRGPLSRREIVLVGECTPEQLARLEEDAPTFAALFQRIFVSPTTPSETFQILLHESRRLEQERRVIFLPGALRTLLEVGPALLPAQGQPGQALDMLRKIAREDEGDDDEPEVIGGRDILGHIAQKTGLPWMLVAPEKPLAKSELVAELGAQVLGQEQAVSAVADVILRVKAGLADPKRPFGVLLFTGPTGTGKTELAKCLAEYLFGSGKRLARFDMSELSAPDAPGRLIGDSWQPEGQLTQAVMEQPFSVVLLDEIEKAHPSVLNLLLQLFDEGRLTDASGNVASFRQCVIVMTSNLGAKPQNPLGFGAESAESILRDISRAVKEFFPPELFNRIDRIVPFHPLTREVAIDVAQKELGKLLARRGLLDRQVFVQAGRGVVERVAQLAFEQRDGARSLKRFLEDRIGARLAEEIASGMAGTHLMVLRVLEGAGDNPDEPFVIEREALCEAEPTLGVYPLEALLDAPLARCLAAVPAAIVTLDTLEAAGATQALENKLRAGLVAHQQGGDAGELFAIDTVREAVANTRERLERLITSSRQERMEQLEYDHFSHERVSAGESHSYREVRVRVLARPSRTGVTKKDEVLTSLAEAYFISRVVHEMVNHPENLLEAGGVNAVARHSVLIELARMGPNTTRRFAQDSVSNAPANFLRWMVQALVQRPEITVDQFVVATRVDDAAQKEPAKATVAGGTLGTGEPREFSLRSSQKLDATIHAFSPSLYQKGTESVFLRVSGLCVLDRLTHETGTHVWQPLASAPELVRVEVHAIADDIVDFASRRLSALIQYERNEPGSVNPRKILPITRNIRFDPPRPGGGPQPIDIEDYALGWTGSTFARSLGEVLDPLALVHLSRTAQRVEP